MSDEQSSFLCVFLQNKEIQTQCIYIYFVVQGRRKLGKKFRNFGFLMRYLHVNTSSIINPLRSDADLRHLYFYLVTTKLVFQIRSF